MMEVWLIVIMYFGFDDVESYVQEFQTMEQCETIGQSMVHLFKIGTNSNNQGSESRYVCREVVNDQSNIASS